MATEDELPEELDKLEITPILQQVKLLDNNLAVQLNPFFENDVKDTGPEIKGNQTTGTIITQQSLPSNISRAAISCRRCRYRHASESVIDELKHTTINGGFVLAEYPRTTPNGVLKQTLKKSSLSSVGGPGNRKVLLREPVLKALQTCIHPHSNVRRKLLASTATNTAISGNDGLLVAKGMSDFRDLIDECRNLLSEDVDFSGRHNQLSLSNRNSKKFTTIQTPKTQSNNNLHNNRRQILSKATLSASTSALTSKSSSSQSASSLSTETGSTPVLHDYHQHTYAMSLLQPSLLGHSINSNSTQQRIINNLSPEHASNARCNTSCSQQAGNSAATCDDVTIDELASYFDTFVHIPKKMSSMAEMMYI